MPARRSQSGSSCHSREPGCRLARAPRARGDGIQRERWRAVAVVHPAPRIPPRHISSGFACALALLGINGAPQRSHAAFDPHWHPEEYVGVLRWKALQEHVWRRFVEADAVSATGAHKCQDAREQLRSVFGAGASFDVRLLYDRRIGTSEALARVRDILDAEEPSSGALSLPSMAIAVKRVMPIGNPMLGGGVHGESEGVIFSGSFRAADRVAVLLRREGVSTPDYASERRHPEEGWTDIELRCSILQTAVAASTADATTSCSVS